MTRTLWRIGAWFALGTALAAGLYARFHALGARQLAIDEYYFVRSVGFILDHGLPRFPNGGLYMPGLIPQYLAAAAVSWLGDGGFAWRLPSVLCSLAGVGLAYFYGRRHLGPLPAAAVSLALLVSSWEIEFARFARMYAAFQCATLVFLIVAGRAFIDRRRAWLYVPHAVCAATSLIHLLGVLLAPLLFLPLFDRRSPMRASRIRALIYTGVSLATTLFCVVVSRFDLRNRGIANRFPADFTSPAGGSFLRIPELPYFRVSSDPQINLIALIGAIAIVALLLLAWRWRGSPLDEAALLAALASAAAAFHALTVVAVCLAVLVLRRGLLAHPPRTRALVLAALLCGAGWSLHVWRSAASLGAGGRSPRGTLLSVLFGWPDFYGPLIRPWAEELPLLGALVLASIVGVLFTRSAESWAWIAGSPLFVVGYVALFVGSVQSSYRTTRYLFFIYPVMLVVIALGAVEAVSWILDRWGRSRARGDALAAGLFLTLFLLSRDFNPAHIAGIAGAEVSLRTGRFERYAATWYPRFDFRSPAEFVNEVAGPQDAIVVVGEPPVSFYLTSDHAVFYERSDQRFRNVSRERGTLELWSNQRLLSSESELRAFAADHGALWIVRAVGPHGALPAIESVLADPAARFERTMLGQDGRLELLRVDGLGRREPTRGP